MGTCQARSFKTCRRQNFNIHNRAQEYANVVILKFGSIQYKTDLVTTVNIRIMRYLVIDLELKFDYLITLDGASYPLYTAHDLARALQHSNRHVFLGELKHFGRKITNMEWAYNNVLHRFTLTHTYADHKKGYQPIKVTRDEANLPVGDMRYYLKSKTNSGNTAIYSYDVVEKLLTSSTALKIHSFHKYGCCHYPPRHDEQQSSPGLRGTVHKSVDDESTANKGAMARPCLNVEYKGRVDLETLKSICPFRVKEATFPGLSTECKWKTHLYCPRTGRVDVLEDAERKTSLAINDAVSLG